MNKFLFKPIFSLFDGWSFILISVFAGEYGLLVYLMVIPVMFISKYLEQHITKEN